MIKKKKPRISNIPLVLSLFMILIFGVPTTLMISLYEYHSLVAGRQEVEAEYLQKIKERLRRDLEVAVDILDYRRSESEGQLKTRVREVVNNTHNMMRIIQTTLDKKIPDSSPRSLIGQWLAEATFFQGRGYVFAFDMNGEALLRTRSLTRENVEAGDHSENDDRQIAHSVLDAVRENDADFIRYPWPLPERPDKVLAKISYVRRFRPFDWVIGAGDYPVAFEHRIKDEMIQTFRFFNKGGTYRGIILDAEGHRLIGDENPEGMTGLGKQAGLSQALDAVMAEARKQKEAFAFAYDEGAQGSELTSVTAMVYGRYYAPWGWTLATMVDLQPFHRFVRQKFERLKAKIIRKYAFLCGVMAVAMGFAVFIGKLFARRLKKNLSAFEDFLHKAGRSPDQMDLEKIPFEELHALGGYANAMVRERVQNEADDPGR